MLSEQPTPEFQPKQPNQWEISEDLHGHLNVQQTRRRFSQVKPALVDELHSIMYSLAHARSKESIGTECYLLWGKVGLWGILIKSTRHMVWRWERTCDR
jgi:hypothetical protein